LGKILEGIRVLDFTDALSGPFCTRYLADCGCEVINIERPGGKANRSIPFFFKGQGIEYIFNHCGKKSIVIDLKNAESHELVMKLAEVCDVVIENFRPGIMKGFDLDYQAFKKVNPSIIMCSISGWGQSGTKSELMAADLSVQALSGILDLTGEPDGPPVPVGFPVTDFLAGLNAFGAICAALYNRAVTGKGNYIDISMLDCAATTLQKPIGLHLFTEGKMEDHRVGRFSSSISPHGIYKGSDGYIAISARTDIAWGRLADLMGKPELATDPRFKSVESRVKNNKALAEKIEEWLTTFDRVADVALLLQSYRILAAPVMTAGQIIQDTHFKKRDMFREVEHPVLGNMRILNSPLKFTNSKASVDEPPSANPGDDTEYVLGNILKMDSKEIIHLTKSGVVAGTK
jgi:crotonobetainyl-CoA:carnitine CoA-transferase CaiB-like acyl-CoA transferase